jgi:hypothetical protein
MADMERNLPVIRLENLTDDQRCVLLNAVEESDLFNVLMECATGRDWDELFPHLPSVAQIVEDFLHKGFVSLYTYSDDIDHTIIDIPDDEARTILADPANWKPGSVRLISLAPTDKGLALYRGEEVSPDRPVPERGRRGADRGVLDAVEEEKHWRHDGAAVLDSGHPE